MTIGRQVQRCQRQIATVLRLLPLTPVRRYGATETGVVVQVPETGMEVVMVVVVTLVREFWLQT